ncbi:hypothetical protein BUALT_Bualt01G0149400 [Buddleja alternifolia]|uniref:Transcription factor n=1 Tax=Buddleja alternifolia TaxID=168488 RepID=A0AAV6Y8S4_9LAMI|nr:hypothetical protein BUALT_Bualt01G0149400 [Buddleja alternifolia]
MGHSIGYESEEGVFSTDSPLSNDGDNSGGSSNMGVGLKKGPWTSAEDAILVDYVKKHGEGNWNAVQKHSGLSRCGKSCRLRWANHLRPNLKKGAFTSEEERLIIELHAKMGNKWARMAAHLPGRTDNEIKNYWNTRIKRRQRAGLPLYPPEICLQASSENQENLNSSIVYGGDKGYHDILQNDGYETPNVIFDRLNILPYTPEFPDISASGSLINGFNCPQFHSFVPQMVGLQKRTQDPDETMSDYGEGAANEALSFDRVQNNNFENKTSQSYGLCFPYDPGHTEKLLPLGVNQDSHFTTNGFFSASKPFAGAETLELPSLQYQETDLGFWDPPPESMDSFIHASLSGPLSSHCTSPRSSGLLEALLYEAKALRKSENQLSDNATSSTTGGIADISAMKTCSTEFNGYLDPTSPSANSMGSIFNQCTPTHTIGSSLEEKMRVPHVKSEVVDESWFFDGETKDISNQMDCSRPDVILGSSWSTSGSAQRGSVTDAIAVLLGSAGTSTSASNRGLCSCTWNNMPSVCQMSDHP